MTIDEAIEKNRKIAETKKTLYDACVLEEYNRHLLREYKEHEQLAEWLEALKDYRDKNKMVVRIDIENMDSIRDKIEELSKYAESQYNKAIDDFAEKLNAKCDGMINDTWNSNVAPISWAEAYADFKDDIDDIAEQLKAGANNEISGR